MTVQETDAAALYAQISSVQGLRLIDVRTPAEVAQGVLPDADHIALHLLPLRMHEISTDAPVVLYCRSGARSAQACMYLMAQGYRNVVNLSGGIISWLSHGFPLARPAYA